MIRISWKRLLFIVLVLITVAGCRKKTMQSTSGRINTDTIPAVSSDTFYVQNAMHTSINSNIGGFYEALPPGYNSNTIQHPLLVFLHGGGELGNGNEDLPLVLKNAIPALIEKKIFPQSFTVEGKQYSFIIISPQFKEWPKPVDVDAVVNYAFDHYRVDTQRVYLVGLSMGGGATWEYAAKHGKRLAAMVPICGASWADSLTAKEIAATETPTWAFHNMDDDAVTVRSTTRYVDFIKYYNPGYPVKVTLWPTGGHDAWTKASDPLYREDGRNIYEWMLQYIR